MSVKNVLSLTSAISSKGRLGVLAAIMSAGIPTAAMADSSWTDYTVKHGTVSTAASSTLNHTKINVDSRVGIVTGNMDIHANDTVTLKGSGEIFAFKDNRANVGTQILGKLKSPGSMTVVLVDRNGVFFGANSVVNVGNIVVATGKIKNKQLIDGKDGKFGTFDVTELGDGEINLNGRINAGLAGFVSKSVINNGTINANVASMGAAGRVTIDLYGDKLLEIQAGDDLEKALLENNGKINAGEIYMTAQSARKSIDAVVNMKGVANASSVSVKGGKIVLSAGKQGTVNVKKSAKVTASGTKGGKITLKGGIVNVAKDAKVLADTNTASKGGSVKIVATRKSTIRGLVSAQGTGGTIDLTVGNKLSLLAGGKLRSDAVNVDTPLANLDGDIQAETITGTVQNAWVLGSTNGAQINDAIGIAATGATINVESGVYNEAVVVDKSVSLLGNHAGTSGADGSRGTGESVVKPNSPGFLVTANNVVIDGFTVRGGDAGVIINGARGVDVLNNRFLNQTHPSGDGAGFGSAGKGDGVYAVDSAKVVISGNRFSGQNDDAVQVSGGKNITVSDNVINNKDGDLGVSISGASGTTNVTGNKIVNAKRHGVVVEKTSGTINISKNIIRQPGDTGIVSRWNKAETVIEKNIVSDAVTGVSLTEDSNSRITGNRVLRTSGDAIKSLRSNNVKINKNIVRVSGGNGIAISGGTGLNVRKNTIRNVSLDGISIQNFGDAWLAKNNIKWTGDDGIYAQDGHFVSISDNKIDLSGYALKQGKRRSYTVKVGHDANGIYVGNVGDESQPKISGKSKFGKSLGFADAEIYGNSVSRSEDDGIQVVGLEAESDQMAPVNQARKTKPVKKYNDHSAYIADNKVGLIGDDGVDIDDVNRVIVDHNVIGFVKDKGITIDGGRHADVFDNNIFFTGNDGIQVENINSRRGYAVDVSGNTISNTGGDGIEVSDSSSAWIEGNVIKGSGYYTRKGADGIHLNNVGGNGRLHVRTKGPAPYSVVIRKNDIDKSGDDGIQVLNSGDTLVERNTISNSGSRFNRGHSADGINIETALNNQQDQGFRKGQPRMQSVRVDVIKNTVSNSGDDGIQIVGATDVLVKGNTVSNSGDDGINVLGFAQSSFYPMMGDTRVVMKRPPISEFKARIVNNTVTDSGTEIKKPVPRSKFKSEYDFSKMSGGDGIQVEGFDRAVVKGGSVSNSVENGLYVSGPNNGKVIVSGVTFNDNDTGAHFESGRIDLTKEGNTFNGGRVGMKFSPVIVGYDYDYDYDSMEGLEFAEARVARPIFQPIFSQLSLKDTDGRGQGFGGTIGSQTFNGQSDFYIELDNGALFNPGTPTVLDASQSTFDGIRPASQGNVLTDAQFAAINGKIFDYRDRNDLGLFFFGANENTDSVNQEEVFNRFDPYGFGGGDVQVTILGLPSTSAGGGTPTGAAALNNIAPAAGDEEEELAPEELNALSAAAGGNSQKAKSWSDAASSARSGGATTFSFGSTLGASAL